MGIICFLADVHQCNIAIVLCMYNFLSKCFFAYYSIVFLPAWVATSKYNIFMLPVGLCEWKITDQCTLTFTFKNILRIFETEIFKVIKNIANIQPRPRNYTCLQK